MNFSVSFRVTVMQSGLNFLQDIFLKTNTKNGINSVVIVPLLTTLNTAKLFSPTICSESSDIRENDQIAGRNLF